MGDLLYIETGRSTTLIAGDDSRISEYADDFETLLENALSADESVEFIKKVMEEMS